MDPAAHTLWQEANDRYTTAVVAWVRALLLAQVEETRSAARQSGAERASLWSRLTGRRKSHKAAAQLVAAAHGSVEQAAASMRYLDSQFASIGAPSQLEQMARQFRLSSFERHVVALGLAFELDTRIGWACGELQDQPYRPFPTFALALSLFAEADWNAIPPSGRLRHFRLIKLGDAPGTPTLGAELRLPEAVVHYLRGIRSLDDRLAALVSPLPAVAEQLYPSQFDTPAVPAQSLTGVTQLLGASVADARRVAQRIASGWSMYILPLENLPSSLEELDEWAGLWQRDSTLHQLALFVDAQACSPMADAAQVRRLQRFAGQVSAPIFVSAPEQLPLLDVANNNFEVPPPTGDEQRDAWLAELPHSLERRQQFAGELSRQFTFDRTSLHEIVATQIPQADQTKRAAAIWHAARARSRPRLEGLAQPIDVKAGWADLVVNSDCQQLLRQICGQVRYRWRVYDEWGFALTMNRGLGISALFAGESGTGKTMAAEVLANDLQLDLYRVDLSSVVNKYVGETEKHLRRLFDAFESSGAILFFDECDALFGKRSEVKDSHDRYANIEISYLLQRLESYRGLAILATNNREALDTAFLRRLRFVVGFEMPTEAEQEQIWRSLLAPQRGVKSRRIPCHALAFDRLAKLRFAGGNIHNVVLNAAFRAAQRDEEPRVTMRDLLAAARDEYLKLDRLLIEDDFLLDEPISEEAVA